MCLFFSAKNVKRDPVPFYVFSKNLSFLYCQKYKNSVKYNCTNEIIKYERRENKNTNEHFKMAKKIKKEN